MKLAEDLAKKMIIIAKRKRISVRKYLDPLIRDHVERDFKTAVADMQKEV